MPCIKQIDEMLCIEHEINSIIKRNKIISNRWNERCADSNNLIYLYIYVKEFHFSPKTNECNNGRNKAKPLESKVNHKRGN